MFEGARTRAAVLEIMRDELVSIALHDPMDSRAANSNAWAQMAGVIMRFSANPGYQPLQPPRSLSPRQRAIWIVYAFSRTVAASSSQPELALALDTAVSSYAQSQNEEEVAQKARTAVDRLVGRS